MAALPGVERLWVGISLPGIYEPSWHTYSPTDLDRMPPIDQAFDGSLDWLLAADRFADSLERSEHDYPQGDADAAGLLAVGAPAALPPAFRRFIEDPEPRRHIRSATACYLDLADFVVPIDNGGSLIHFLTDQQSVMQWLLYVGPDGSEAVLPTPDSLGFNTGDDTVTGLIADEAPGRLSVCAESFEEFLYRFWIENELFYRVAVTGVTVDALPEPLRTYALGYPKVDPVRLPTAAEYAARHRRSRSVIGRLADRLPFRHRD